MSIRWRSARTVGAWILLRRWWIVSAVLLAAAVVSMVPGEVLRTAGWVGRFVVRFWLPLVLIMAAGLSAMVAVRSRGDAAHVSRRRGRTPRLPLLVHVTLLLGLATVVAFGVAVVLWQAVGRPALHGTPAAAPSASGAVRPAPAPAAPVGGSPVSWSVTHTFDAMKIVLAVVGGIGGVVALTVAYRRPHLGEAAERREDTKLFTDRFVKAVELMGSEQAAVRLAGVYAVAALADDWTEGRQMCIDVLCAYLRMPYTPPPPVEPSPASTPANPDPATSPAGTLTDRLRQWLRRPHLPPAPVLIPAVPDKPARDPHEERQVRHTVIRLIRDHLRLPTNHAHSWQGCDLDFTSVVFDGGDLVGAVFSGGRVNFGGASFAGGTVNFGDASFSGGTVNFGGASFAGGTVNFDFASFSDGMVNFDFARFSGGLVNFVGASFSGGLVDFGGARFSGGLVHFLGARFSGGTVNFGDASFSGGMVHFGDASFSGGLVDLSGVAEWIVPAQFETWSDGPPAGLLLPPSGPSASGNAVSSPGT